MYTLKVLYCKLFVFIKLKGFLFHPKLNVLNVGSVTGVSLSLQLFRKQHFQVCTAKFIQPTERTHLLLSQFQFCPVLGVHLIVYPISCLTYLSCLTCLLSRHFTKVYVSHEGLHSPQIWLWTRLKLGCRARVIKTFKFRNVYFHECFSVKPVSHFSYCVRRSSLNAKRAEMSMSL